MTLAIALYTQFKGFAVASEDIAVTEVETRELPCTTDGGTLLKARFVRYGATVQVRGVLLSQALPFIQQAEQVGIQKLRGGMPTETLELGGRTILRAALERATVSQPVAVGDSLLCETLELVYESQVFV